MTETPLLVAAGWRNREIVKLLLSKGANINTTDKLGNSPLLYAAKSKNTPMVELLLDNGADINHVNHAGESALLISCYDSNRMLTKLLVDRGADVFVASKNGLSPIWYACSNNQKEIVELFLNNGVDVNYAKPVNDTTDSMYSYLDWVETANNLASDSNFSLNNTYNYGGESLIHVAAKSGHISMIKLLLDKGAQINVQDESGNSALHYAAANGKKDMVKLLLENNADASIVNAKEQKAIDYSNIKGYNEITELLLKASPANGVNTNFAKAPDSDPVQTAPKNDMASKKQALLDLKELLDAGILSQEEFDGEKTKILKG